MPTPAEIQPLPFLRAARLLALLCLLIAAMAVISNLSHPRQMDFASFWAAAVMALHGNAPAVYDVAAHQIVQDQAAAARSFMPFAYPPPFLLALVPFGMPPYGIAAALWVIAGFGLYWASAKGSWPESGWYAAAFPPVLANCMIGQSGLLTGAMFLAGATQFASSPFLSGLLFGCLIVKPQLGILLPIAFLAGGHFRAFAGAALSAVTLLLVAALIYGVETYRAMVDALPGYSVVAFESDLAWRKMVSIYASLRLIGVPGPLAWSVQMLVAVLATVTTAVVWRRCSDVGLKLAILFAATALISPYLFVYDLVMLLLPFMVLLLTGRNTYLLAALWCLPLLHLAAGWGLPQPVNLMPLLPLGLIALILIEIRRDGAGAMIRVRPA